VTLFTYRLGCKTYSDIPLVFKIVRTGCDLSGWKIWLTDKKSGTETDLDNGKEFRIGLDAGEYTGRFWLNLSPSVTGITDDPMKEELVSIYSSQGVIKTFIDTNRTGEGQLTIHDLSGRLLFVERNIGYGYNDYYPGLKDGIYIVTYNSKNYRMAKKIFIRNR